MFILLRTLMLLSVCSLLTLASTDSSAQDPTVVKTMKVYPHENNECLINPGKGWIIYSSFSNASAEAWAKASVGYTRIMWKDVHTGDNTFDWKHIDDMRDECTTRGKKFAFGIMSVSVNSPEDCNGMPDWVVAAGARFYLADRTQDCKVPVWDDPVFVAKIGQLVAALTKRYNGDPDIEYIDCRTYGNWGEWHLSGIGGEAPGEAILKQYIDQWAGFDKTHIIVPISGGAGMQLSGYGLYARDVYQFGAREDSSEDPDRWTTCLPFMDNGPAVAEFSWLYERLKLGQGRTGKVWNENMLLGQIEGSKYSYVPLGEWNGKDADIFLADHGLLVDEWQNKMGYWFKMTVAAYPSDLGNGTKGTISFTIRNDGVAPIYIKKNAGVAKLALMDSGRNVLATCILTGVNPCNWKPGQSVTDEVAFSFPNHAKGVKLAFGVFTKPDLAHPDIRLGIDHGTKLNWYVLSDMPEAAVRR